MHFLRKNWQVASIVAVVTTLVLTFGVAYALRSQAAETKIETAEFFTVPVHVLLPNDNYVKSYQVQTNELVSLRSMLAYNDIATFSESEILKVNEYDQEQKLVKSFPATAEAPFYLRVVAKDKSLLSYYQDLIQPATSLAERYLAKAGIEIIIEQQYYNEATAEMAFLTNAEIQASLQAKTIELTEVGGYYDEYGNWIADEPEAEAPEWDVEIEDATIVCSANQTLVAGVCEPSNTLNDQSSSPSNDAETDTNTDEEQVTPPPIAPNPEPTPEPNPEPNPEPKPPVCNEGEELVGGACQPVQPTPPDCGADEELVGDECQLKPESDPQILVPIQN